MHTQEQSVLINANMISNQAVCICAREIQHVSRFYSPVYRGGLFSMKAAMPSCLSRVGMTWEDRANMGNSA